ncbi:hypothetical protein QBC39DRAFT_47463 [Podospora conica]|nr:hypothetical protein QBC39DRAFT_47463 [Schizothecium conicum]
MEELDLLILGAGWTATFLIPLLTQHRPDLSFAATTTDGRPVADHPTLPFRFDPADPSNLAALPRARHILVTFPLKGAGPSAALVRAYTAAHTRGPVGGKTPFRFIQLGSTGIWQPNGPTVAKADDPWISRHSPYDKTNPRAVAEDELLGLGGVVLNLSGLWGGARDPRTWVGRVGATKDAVKGKKSLHMVHGEDVARGVVGVIDAKEWRGGERWMLTDGFVYDWWALMVGWGGKGEGEVSEQARWVWELMEEEGVKGLPRGMEVLGRCYDAAEFWRWVGVVPRRGGLGVGL